MPTPTWEVGSPSWTHVDSWAYLSQNILDRKCLSVISLRSSMSSCASDSLRLLTFCQPLPIFYLAQVALKCVRKTNEMLYIHSWEILNFIPLAELDKGTVLTIIYWACKRMTEILRKQSQFIPLILGKLSANIHCKPREDLAKTGWRVTSHLLQIKLISSWANKDGWRYFLPQKHLILTPYHPQSIT